MDTHTGRFSWYELATTDLESAQKFYSEVIGWRATDAKHPTMTYILFNVGDAGIAGMLELPKEALAANVPAHWIGYINSDDVDMDAGAIQKEGGKILMAPADIPNVGRFSIVSDPQGASFVLFKPAGSAPSLPLGTAGTFGWNELHADASASAFDFYSKHFGWQKGETIEMGPMGVYQIFMQNGQQMGGIMDKAPEMSGSTWLYYINVDDINAAAGRVKNNGGKLLNGPQAVPGGQWVAQCKDPQGAIFAMVAPK